MSRINQLHPGQYTSAAKIGNEFENILRYLVAAELGNFTLAELLLKIFDDSGNIIMPLEIRYDAATGIEYRIGEYIDAEEAWAILATADELRGADGSVVGTIGAPLIYNRQDFTASGSQTVFSYVQDDEVGDVFVFVDGLLSDSSQYTRDAAADTVTFGTPLAGGELVSITSVRASSVSGYARNTQTSAGQAVFPFVHDPDDQFLVFRNGILQRYGGSNDYVSDANTDSVTFTTTLSVGDIVEFVIIENVAQTSVGGLMTEAKYTDGTGYIPYSKMAFADGDIPAAKVDGMAALLANRGRVLVQASAPVGVVAGDIWIDTSVAPDRPYFYDSTQWVAFSSDTDLPDISSSNKNQILHVNSTGTGLIWKDVDLSAYVLNTAVGQTDGVASLNGSGTIPTGQIPESVTYDGLYHFEAGALANASFQTKRIYKQKLRLDAISVRLASGSCDLTLQVDGADVGSTFSITSTATEQNLAASILIDATTTSKTIGFRISSGASPTDLDLTLATVTPS